MSDRPVCPSCGHENEPGARYCAQCAASMTAGPSGKSTPQKKKVGPAIVLVIAFVALPILLFAVFSKGSIFGHGKTEGEIVSAGAPHGDWSLRPSSCYSGEHEDFFGVWAAPELSDSGGRSGWKGGLKVVRGHTGQWEAYLESPLECERFDCVIREVDSAHCSVFDIDVRNTGTIVNDIRVREGHAKLDCEFPEGGTLQARLTFEGCK